LTETDPRNTRYGGEQRTHFIWKGLKKVADVYTVIPVARKEQERVDETDNIRWFCFERRWTPGWVIRRVWRRFFPRVGLPCGWNMGRLKGMYPFAFDTCVVRYVTLASFLRAWRIAPMVLDADDLLTEDFDSWHLHQLTWREKAHRKLLETYQNIVFEKARHVWVSNRDNLRLLNKFSASWLPNVPLESVRSFEKQTNSSQVIIFVGLLAFDQNYLSLDRFLVSTWNAVSDVFPGLVFKIVGGGLPPAYRARWASYRNVKILGFQQDLEPLFRESMAVLAPLYMGAGTSIKVLEALSMGRVCFVTSVAARGVQPDALKKENGLFLFGSSEELVDGLKSIENAEQRLFFQQGGKAFVERHYTQEKVNEIIVDTFSMLLQRA
jgi:glycosyltransferase involved in cell wall biosynthesis